jgi:hypothetical protein
MAKLKLLGAAALLAGAIAMPVMAQQALPEQNMDTQYYPYANSDNYSYGSPGWHGDSYAYYGGGTGYYADRPVSRRTTCGPRPDAPYLGPGGRGYPC